jgi:PTS system ascorbate-specific IIA component
MIGILIIAHGNLGESLIQCATHVLNKVPPRVVALGVSAKDDPALLLPVRELDNGSGVLVLTDMYGGSPSNMASKVVVPGRVEAVCGINLPMLIRVLTYRERDLQTIVTKAVSGGCEGVMRVPMFKMHNAATGS